MSDLILDSKVQFTMRFIGVPTLAEIEDHLYKKMIELYGMKPFTIARVLGVGKSTVYRKLASLKKRGLLTKPN